MSAPEPPRGLLVATVALPDDPDVLSLADRDGVVFSSPGRRLVGWGEALSLPLRRGLADPGSRAEVRRALRCLEVADDLARPGTGAVALGALPFLPHEPARLVVPEVLVGHDDQGSWLTVVHERGRGSEPARLVAERRQALRGARALRPLSRAEAQVLARPEPEAFCAAVAQAVRAIRAGRLRKVVLARCLDLMLPGALDPVALTGSLQALDRSSTGFCLPHRGGHFLGASPELVVARTGRQVRCQPLAGTAPLAAGDLLGSAKNREEHQLVVDAVGEALAPYAEELSVPAEPDVVPLGTDTRLSTSVTATLGQQGEPDALELLAALHPTPAVGGVPRSTALELIARLEPLPRELWAGAVGWLSGNGDGAFMLGIRSVLLGPSEARLWAGAGIVAGSDPEEELAETTLKLDPVRKAVEGAPSGPPARDGVTGQGASARQLGERRASG